MIAGAIILLAIAFWLGVMHARNAEAERRVNEADEKDGGLPL